MKNKSIDELNYVELRNGHIICLEDITDMNIFGGFSYTDYTLNIAGESYKISYDEYNKIRNLLHKNANSYTIL